MPSTRQVNATLQSLPCIEQDGMVWIWPGSATPTTTLPALLPPSNYTIHAQVCAEPCDTQSYAPPRETIFFSCVCKLGNISLCGCNEDRRALDNQLLDILHSPH
jgi:hypothetical protein